MNVRSGFANKTRRSGLFTHRYPLAYVVRGVHPVRNAQPPSTGVEFEQRTVFARKRNDNRSGSYQKIHGSVNSARLKPAGVTRNDRRATERRQCDATSVTQQAREQSGRNRNAAVNSARPLQM